MNRAGYLCEKDIDRRHFIKEAIMASLMVSMTGCAGAVRARREIPPAGRFMMIDIPGPELDTETAAFIREYGIRAILLFQRNIVDSEQVRRLTAQLRDVIGPGALIAVDQEGGAVVRTSDLPYPPSAMSLGASGDTELAYQVGNAVGRSLNSLGINWNFAPSLDVNNNPLNPVIGDRSFGSDPKEVARLGLAWAEGCQAGGVATCVKHFPGHGDTVVDSHLGLPVVNKSRAELQALELYPFEQAVRAGIPAIMTSHIVYPALDPEYPATLSPAILTGLLRETWGYDGVVITDAMNMQAITERYGRGEGALRALHAGADMVLAQGSRADQRETAQAIDQAIREGAFSEDRLDASLQRLIRLASQFPSEPEPYTREQRQEDERLMRHAWEAGLTAYLDPQPPAPGTKVLLLMAASAAGGGASDRGLSSRELIDELRGLYDLEVVTYAPQRPLDALDELVARRKPESTVLFVSTSRLRADQGLRTLIGAANPDLHIALWNPYLVLDVPAPALITYGFRPEALQAVLAWLRGEIDARGRIPIELA